MLELNTDILDSSKKVTVNSICSSGPKKSGEETRASWKAAIADLMSIMEFRAIVLKDRPISKDPARLAAAPLPAECRDTRGAPPEVVWLAPVLPPRRQQGGDAREGRVVRPRRAEPSAASASSSGGWEPWDAWRAAGWPANWQG
jgi:hypothetical protein